jgi:putative membrane protein
MWWNDWWWPMPGMFFGPIMLVFVVVCVVMMFYMMRGRGMHFHRDGSAIEILKERFARGEITKSEYEEARRTLEA